MCVNRIANPQSALRLPQQPQLPSGALLAGGQERSVSSKRSTLRQRRSRRKPKLIIARAASLELSSRFQQVAEQ
jgi:hypothetical protein